ncbi:MAG: alpha/beta hydrolase [Nocardioides sp.]
MTALKHALLATPLALGLLLATAACDGGEKATTPATLHVSACTVQDRDDARCGTLDVPENRLTGEGRTIPVKFVVVPATSPDRSENPWVFLAGGPGDAATDAAAGFVGLTGVNTRHDLVFIDQRGTGGSNPLTCPMFPDLADKPGLRQSVESCVASLHADLRFYTTAMFADDVDEVLDALGYDSVDLMGVSYGTLAARVLLRRHPDRVRSMMLLNGSPLTVPIYKRMAGSAQAALESVFARCAGDPTCRGAFPDLRADWERLWSSLSRAPWVLDGGQSPTGHEVRLDTSTLARVLNQMLRNSELAAGIPVLVHALGSTPDHAAALKRIARVVGGVSSDGEDSGGTQNMITYPFMCNEPWASSRPSALADQQDSFEYQNDVELARRWRYICRSLPPAPAAAVGADGAPASDVPVLVLNGEADPIDPPAVMADASQLWPNSRRLVAPGQGHDINPSSWTSCLSDLTARFIERGSVKGLDTSCVKQVLVPPFALDLRSLNQQ